MRIFQVIGILTTLAALFAYVNYRLFRLPVTVGLMLQSLLFSLLLMLLSRLGLDFTDIARDFLQRIDFNEVLLEGILSFLLFAGALFVDPDDLLQVKRDVALLAVVGVLVSTAVVAFGIRKISILAQQPVGLASCLLFGALISPTDPVAVLATLKKTKISRTLHARITGEALFNDGIGIVLFLALLPSAQGQWLPGLADMGIIFARQTIGGIIYGGAIGWFCYLLLKSVDDYQLEILITLALVSGGYSLARILGVSGPLAMVTAGLLIGGRGRRLAMSRRTRENLDRFWELVEEMLNAVLFTLIGLEVLLLAPHLSSSHLLLAAAAVPLTLLARWISAGGLALLLKSMKPLPKGSISIMTWSGIRGGISIALALSLPPSADRSLLIFATYLTAVFSILVQGTAIHRIYGKRDD